jgi:hypothetical protein
MPVFETALTAFAAGDAGQLGREATVRSAMLAERTFSEIQKSVEGLRAGEAGRDVPAETVAAQAEALLLEREAIHRLAIREASPFSEGVTERIRNPDEVAVYRQAGPREAVGNDRPGLIRSDIDLSGGVDDHGRTNTERMQSGLSPLDPTGRTIELHHIGQQPDSPLAELRFDEHKGHTSVLHERCESSIDRAAFATERASHWKERAAQIAV